MSSFRKIIAASRPVARFLTRHGWVPLATLALAIGGAWAFLGIAGEVREGETKTFDDWLYERIAVGLYDSVGGFWHQAGQDLTALGGGTVIALLTGGVVVFLLLQKQWRTAAVVAVAVVGGLLLSLGLKEFFDRPRPHVVGRTFVMTSSFPSGHAANAAAAYLTLAILVANVVKGTRMKVYLLFLGLLLPLLVGFSRVFLGVHWPTDVIGGWLIGLAWGLLVYAVARLLQRKGVIESGDSAPRGGDATSPRLPR